MLRGIEFHNDTMSCVDDRNQFTYLTPNTIVICYSIEAMERLANEIMATVNGQAEHNLYECDREDVGTATCLYIGDLARILCINNQTIAMSVEPAMVYRATEADDIWFLDWTSVGKTHKDTITPFVDYRGSRELWEHGLDKVYRQIVLGRYGGVEWAISHSEPWR